MYLRLAVAVMYYFDSRTKPQIRNSYSSRPHVLCWVLLALGVACFGAIANVAIAACPTIDSSVLLFWCGVVCIPVGLVACSFDPKQRFISQHIADIPATEWGELALQSSLSLTGTLFATLSIKMANPILASMLTPVVEIVLGYIIQTTVMGEVSKD